MTAPPPPLPSLRELRRDDLSACRWCLLRACLRRVSRRPCLGRLDQPPRPVCRVRGAKKDTTPFPSFLIAHPILPRTRFADDQFSFHPDSMARDPDRSVDS
jgi:hypothetical protein